VTAGEEAGAVRRHVLVHGHVQAVGFRASCARRALQTELGGWVRNTPDGSVEAVFEGDAAAVEALVAWCHTGPPLARVARVEVSDEALQAERGFTIR
jgi:acylphosphatase